LIRRLWSGWSALVALGVVALAVVSFVFPGRRHVALDVFILFVGALGLAIGVRATRGASPDVHGPSLVDELADPLDVLPQRPAELERLEREVHLSLGSSFYLHHRLRPVLREVAAHRLLLRHGCDLDKRPEEAHVLLGDAAWSWLRPDLVEPKDRWAPGPPLAELTAVVDALERI
jgi:hypothetical protein